ncbi:MAG: CHASE3 domain-containing protein [Chloroflexi bacterium]|nr:CHASE3 domain-containing protein [Chloroflexota bacterium]
MKHLPSLSLRWKLLGSFALVLTLLVSLIALAYLTTVDNQRTTAAVEHTLRVTSLASTALASLADMETGYRGYLLTGQTGFLTPYAAGRRQLRDTLAQLRAETADNPTQQARWQEFAERLAGWEQDIVEPMLARRDQVTAGTLPWEPLIQQVGSGEGRQQVEAMRQLLLAAEQEEQALLAERRLAADEAVARLHQTLTIGTATAVALGLALAWLLAHDIAQPMERLAATAGQLATGDLSQRVGLRRRDEIGAAATAFDRMAEELQALVQRHEAILASAAEGIFGLDPQGHVTFANRAAERLTGYTSAEMARQSQHTLIHHSRPDGTPYPIEECPIYQALQSGTCAQRSDEVFWRKDGTCFPVEYTAVPFHDPEQGRGVVITFRDITERLQAEQQLREYAQELARSNADLEQFAYVASHDLQEPLRVIVSYIQLLERRYKNQLDARADKYLAYVVDAGRRMQTLINDLLTYSRVGRRGDQIAPTDTTAVLGRVLANLGAALRDSGATVTHDPLPTVAADETQLGQLFQNLIGNALKFRSDAPPRIHVSAAQRDGEWLFAVRDNGIGIAPEYAERIFVIFQRLHTREEYPGTGIGLAICKKIVERHGGRIWVESTPGAGSTFYFTLPDVDSATEALVHGSNRQPTAGGTDRNSPGRG